MTNKGPQDKPDLGDGWPPRANRPTLPRIPPIPGKVVAMAAVVIILALAGFVVSRSIREVSATEVAVIVNYLSGEKSLRSQPGYVMVFPFIQEIFTFDKTPIQFVMEGDRDRNDNFVSKLTVRASDGSNFSFDRLEIQYEIIPERAAEIVIDDSGPGDAYKANWVKTFARSVLRDEFGRYNAEEVADPSQYESATREARRRLNEILEKHGVLIREIITPKPKFDPKYEKAIEDRKVTNQEVERLKIEAQQLGRERERRLADIERDKATEFERLKGELAAEQIAAERDRVRVEKSADADKISKVNQGKGVEQQFVEQARAQEEMARKEAEGLRARVEALAERGEILVREALAAKLAAIEFTIVPYRRDPTPVRIEHLGGVPPIAGKKDPK